MNPLIPRSRNTTGGFTLVEILVSITILGLIMVGVAQMMNSAMSATMGGYKHMDADTQARMVLDRMAFDISKITKRADVDYYFKKNTGNDQMAFYSESGGYYPSGVTPATQESNVSLVGYMIAPMLNGVYNANGTPQLVRLSKGLVWNGVSSSGNPAMVFNPLPTSITSNTITTNWSEIPNWPVIPTAQASYYQVIGDQVFRLEYCFFVQSSPTAASPTTTVGGFYDSPWYTPDTTPNALKDVTAIVVSIAVLDSKSRGNVSNSALQTAASDLADDSFTSMPTGSLAASTVETDLPLYLWKANLNTALGTGGNLLGLPKAAASQVRFYQRFCYLNHLQ